MQKLLLFAAAMLTACGGPPPADTKVEGSVREIDFPNAFAIYGKTPSTTGLTGGTLFILISTDSAACRHLDRSGMFNRSVVVGPMNERGIRYRIPTLFFRLADPASSWVTQATLGSGLDADLDIGGPGWNWGDPGPTLLRPVAGAITLAQFDDVSAPGARAAGTFNLSFNDGTNAGAMTGTFNATPCQELYAGCSASGLGFVMPGLLALIGALKRRRR